MNNIQILSFADTQTPYNFKDVPLKFRNKFSGEFIRCMLSQQIVVNHLEYDIAASAFVVDGLLSHTLEHEFLCSYSRTGCLKYGDYTDYVYVLSDSRESPYHKVSCVFRFGRDGCIKRIDFEDLYNLTNLDFARNALFAAKKDDYEFDLFLAYDAFQKAKADDEFEGEYVDFLHDEEFEQRMSFYKLINY